MMEVLLLRRLGTYPSQCTCDMEGETEEGPRLICDQQYSSTAGLLGSFDGTECLVLAHNPPW